MANVAEHFISTFEANGIDRIWGIAGDSLNGFTDAMRNSDVEWMNVRHEEAGAFAAAAEAEMTGELAVTAGTAGPGNLHLINGLYDAQRSRVPVLALAAHIPAEEIGTGYFQETHPQELFRECSVYVEQVSDIGQLPRLLSIAMRAAVEKRGVAVLVISAAMFVTELPDAKPEIIKATNSRILPATEELNRAADLLNGCKKVTILAGAGVAGAHDELLEIAERIQAPIVHAMRGKEHVEYDNPYDVGMTGLLGFTSGYRAMIDAEALLMIGTDLPYRQFYPEDVPVIQIDSRGEQIGKRVPVEVPLVGTAKDTIRELLPLLKPAKSSRHLSKMLDHYKKTRSKLDDLARPSRGSRPIHPQYLTRVLDEKASDDAVFIPDVGSPVVYASRYIHTTQDRRVIGSFAHGSMANALTMSLGAQVVSRDRQVIALAGDGGLGMMLGELLTVREHNLPVKIVVYNNSSLNFIELEMKAGGFVPFATDLQNPDYGKVAEAMGIWGKHVERSKDLPGAVKEFLAHDGPAVLDVVTERAELTIPPTISAEQVKGFSLYALRTVLSGKGSELVDLAKVNLRHIL
ncbi:MAG: ubiquinone-dependent pyruvate dehydrogenase [Yaniella sp.]|uniref:ubiquinone-dependent pyruvate dehydrogenase n=2 Tax=Yaniella sp. TaxID=2773929 RepID=UPI002647FB3E|nr:ubiquinone-dependent pyruvate dehydrogenase [Yaniella sp.]MDN5742431.1 ubiquinone-dependent pyruvate dehydrogenase [Yaniella sp.]MDN6148136.1 ubiquinone-dependent pyruvate dehydrogenase [Yaniella sp.]MDN6533044.1 ubiquinone-dependent pyruvate dehydrogenase [Yaniella sp.]MDN6759272.1 ubiquinone-dependent pyruvate dehydrogenase [Yaniella sp.]